MFPLHFKLYLHNSKLWINLQSEIPRVCGTGNSLDRR